MIPLDGQLATFVVLSAILTVLPGTDMALVAKTTLLQGRKAAFATSLGICAGLPVHATASAIGLSAILATSAEAFTAVKVLGALYLGYIGVRSILDSRHSTRGTTQMEGTAEAMSARALAPRRLRGAFTQGFLSNVLNPKVAIFYLTFLPQFMHPGDDILLKSLAFAGIHVALGLPWLTAYSYALDRLARAVSGARRWLERASGVLLIGLGIRLALERR
ncbi:MAG: LysE family translocator [Chloroflexi bacterium]|nr:LysE family translocator [Chloroflexota bacterium]